MATKKATPTISEKVQHIVAKLREDPTGELLTRGERTLEVTREEAAHLLSIPAGRTITTEYLRQLTRGKNPRLVPSRATGNTYLYRVDALLAVQFTKPHKQQATPEAPQEEQAVEPRL